MTPWARLKRSARRSDARRAIALGSSAAITACWNRTAAVPRLLAAGRIARYDTLATVSLATAVVSLIPRGLESSAMEIGLVLLALLVLAVGAYFAYEQQQKRQQALRLLAEELGWQFRAEEDRDHDDQYSHFELFCHGHTRYAYNTLVGAIDVGGAAWPVKMGDFHYQVTTSNGKTTTTHTHRFSYLILNLPYRQLPELLVRREGMFDALKNLFGFDDIDFESAEFSRRFCVKSPDRRFAYDVIHPRMIEFLLSSEPPTVDVELGSCLLADGRDTWSPAEFRATLDWARQFFELWPAHVTSQLEHEPLEQQP
jgi:hypothetical protein